MRRSLPLLFLAVLSLAFAPAPLPRPDPGKLDLDRMQGTWDLIARTFEGRPFAHVVTTVEVRGDRLTYVGEEGRFRSTWSFTLDTKKAPRRFHKKWVEANQPGLASSNTGPGVYDLQGDTLRMCYSTIDRPLPTDLDGTKPGRYLDTLKRRKR